MSFQVIGEIFGLWQKEQNHFPYKIFKVVAHKTAHKRYVCIRFRQGILVSVTSPCGWILHLRSGFHNRCYSCCVGGVEFGIFGNNMLLQTMATQFPNVQHCFFFLYR